MFENRFFAFAVDSSEDDFHHFDASFVAANSVGMERGWISTGRQNGLLSHPHGYLLGHGKNGLLSHPHGYLLGHGKKSLLSDPHG